MTNEAKYIYISYQITKFRCDVMLTWAINDSKLHLFAKRINHKCLIWKEKYIYTLGERIKTPNILISIELMFSFL